MTRQQAIDFLLNRPTEYARMLGFTKLGILHNSWIRDMVRGKDEKVLFFKREQIYRMFGITEAGK